MKMEVYKKIASIMSQADLDSFTRSSPTASAPFRRRSRACFPWPRYGSSAAAFDR